MGCPGQARTKFRRQNRSQQAAGKIGRQPHGGGRRHRRECGTRPHAGRNMRGLAVPGAQPCPTVRYISAQWPASMRQCVLAGAWPCARAAARDGAAARGGAGSLPTPFFLFLSILKSEIPYNSGIKCIEESEPWL
ncbi:hypothetical protein F511_18491 [Dorcoceras hygrometricum]|uniref:Uncharacterized protein n=1 Tax=Dorcoceras hygrometricum TaxID=472368 RepID=A0A2Z7B5P2_9LAMI|nr:hypothetical protein F511_18491 [Dorcoceras hygrometricum]